MMEIPTDIESTQLNYISVDEMVEVEHIEVVEEKDMTTNDTAAASNYFVTGGEADNCSLFNSEPNDSVSSYEEKEYEPEETSNNRVPSRDQRPSLRKRFKTESANVKSNRQKAIMQRVRRQNLVGGLAKLRAAMGKSENEYKTCKKLIDHVIQTILQTERQIECRTVSCLAHENSTLEEKIKKLELENVSTRGSANNTHKQEDCSKE